MNREMSKLLRITVICVLAASEGCGTNSNQSANPSPKPPSESWGTAGTTLSGDRYDLSRDEQRGGHTLNKHVGRTDDELRQRLEREQNISAASTWTNRDAAEQTVGEALRVNREKIQNWQTRGYPRPNLALHFDAGKVTGRSMRHGDSRSTPCTSAVIVLKAASPTSFYVLTTYPEAR
jgi:CDI toxin RNase A-like protein